MDPTPPRPDRVLADHRRCDATTWRVGETEVPLRTKVGVRGHPGVDGALVALAEALRRGRVTPSGRVLDLTASPAALPAWAALAARGAAPATDPAAAEGAVAGAPASTWTLALSSVAVRRAAEATWASPALAGPPPRIVDALPWELSGSFDAVLWRPPADRGWRRQRAELAAVAALLTPDGTAVLLQHKDEGAQRAEREALARFTEATTVAREGGWRVTALRGPRAGEPVDPWGPPDAEGARSLAGVFAADRPDAGTNALLSVLAARSAVEGARVLDLGCGSGRLALAAVAAGAAEVTAVDDDLAAVRTAAARLAGVAGARAVAADLLDPLEAADATRLAPGAFDEVWCNPPFHVGRQVVGALSRAFVAAAHEALRPGGVAWIVVNRALPYERELARWTGVEDATPVGERRYTVWRAVRGRG